MGGRRSRRIWNFALTAALPILLLPAGAPLGGAGDLAPGERAAIERAGRAIGAGEGARGFALLDSLADAAQQRGDTALALATGIARGGHLAWHGRSAEAVRQLEAVLPRAEARDDTSLVVRGAMWLGLAYINQGRHAAADSLYARHLPTAVATGDREREGFMRLGAAYVRLMEGAAREALAGYREAESLLRETGNAFGEIDALTGQGRAWEQLGDLDRARASFEAVAARARAAGRPDNEADALNNIGTIEFTRGDPAVGVGFFRRALSIRHRLGNPHEVVVPAINVARALVELARDREAEATLDSLLSLCRRSGFVAHEGRVLNLLAELRLRQERPAEALRLARDVTKLGADLPVWERAQALRAAARALAALDSLPEALATLEGQVRALRPRLSPDWRLRCDQELVERLLQAGRAGEAVPLARRAAAEAGELRRQPDRIALLTAAGRGEMARGDTLSALRDLRAAAEAWERARVLPSEPEWREHRANSQALSEALLIALLGDPSRPDAGGRREAAFDAAQAFKARTLAERAGGPSRHGPPTPIATAASLRRDALRDGEVLLDFHVGREVSHVFLLDRDGCRVLRLPGGRTLDGRLRLLRDLLARIEPAQDEGPALAALTREAAAVAMGGFGAELRAARRVFVAPDGPLYLVPHDRLLAALIGGPDRAMPEVARIPSASMLALIRSRRGLAGPADGRAGGLVVCADRDAGGRPLRGARREADLLLDRYAGLRLWRAPADGEEEDDGSALANNRLLHFATHAELDDDYPWRSAIVVASAERDGPARRLRAERIAALTLDADLAVLASCESAGGRVLAGEGSQGLVSAFMAAGVPAVVATLWPVEDLAAARVMAAFYAGLSRGLTVGQALRTARQAAAAAGEAPAVWAGFVLAGDPDVSVPLPPLRRRWPAAALFGAAAVAAVAGGLVRRRAARAGRLKAGDRS